MKTLQHAAEQAILVQNACNLSGVVNAFSRALAIVRENTNGTNEANRHPVSVLFTAKIMHLTRSGSMDGQTFEDAYNACHDLVTGGPVPVL